MKEKGKERGRKTHEKMKDIGMEARLVLMWVVA